MKNSYLDGTNIVSEIHDFTMKNPFWYAKVIKKLFQENLLLPPSFVFAADGNQSGWYILMLRK